MKFGNPRNWFKKPVTKEVVVVRADYDMSRDSRYNPRRHGLAPLGGPADYHYRVETDYYTDIEKARDLDRNNSIIGTCLDRSVDNIVQSGFKLDPQTGSKRLDALLWEKFNRWASRPSECDIAGEHTFHELARHAQRSVSRDGDCFALGLESGHLQFIEGHSVQTDGTEENTVLGVTKDEYGRHTQYWIMRDGIEPQDRKEKAVPVDALDETGFRQVFHVYNPKRVSQTRGVSALAPIFETSGMLGDLQFAKLVQQQVAACFVIFRKRSKGGNTALPSKTPGYGEGSVERTPSGSRFLEGVVPGMEIIGEDGEELEGFSPDTPSAGYFEQVKLIMQTIGVNLGLPLCLVLMDGSETNFSGWRGAVDEARKGFRFHQDNLIERFHRPVYEWKVLQFLQDDDVQALLAEEGDLVTDVFGHKWNAPRWSYIDPVGDGQGDEIRMKMTQTSRRRMHAENGDEWEEVATEQVDDHFFGIDYALERAAELNTKYPGAGIQWFHLLPLPMANGIQATVQDPKLLSLQAKDSGGGRQLSVVEALQKIYLSVGTVITPEEARKIMEKEYGIKLPADFDLDSAMRSTNA